MSASQHPIALRLERHVGDTTKLLATVMALPLIDGIFVALVLAGALSTALGIVETGVLIFGGSATMAVILVEMDGSRRDRVAPVLLIGAIIMPVAAVQAALAPTVESLLNMGIFERFAGLVVLAIAAKTASAKVGEVLPSPGVIIALGLVASFDPAGVELAAFEGSGTAVRGAAAAGVGVLFALGVALAAPQLRGRVNVDRFRFGSAVALGVLALPILGLLETEAPIALAVLAVTGLFAYDPDAGGGPNVDRGPDVSGGDRGDDDGREPTVPSPDTPNRAPSESGVADPGATARPSGTDGRRRLSTSAGRRAPASVGIVSGVFGVGSRPGVDGPAFVLADTETDEDAEESDDDVDDDGATAATEDATDAEGGDARVDIDGSPTREPYRTGDGDASDGSARAPWL